MLAEMGTHAKLMGNESEYAKLFKIQADAFFAGAPGNTNTTDMGPGV